MTNRGAANEIRAIPDSIRIPYGDSLLMAIPAPAVWLGFGARNETQFGLLPVVADGAPTSLSLAFPGEDHAAEQRDSEQKAFGRDIEGKP
jgi:hypothetical protein